MLPDQNNYEEIIDEDAEENSELEANIPDQEEVLAEEERIAQEINELESGLADSQKPDEEEIQLKVITDNEENLKIMEYGEEILIPQKNSQGYVIVHSSKTSLERNFYDKGYRLVKKEFWDYKTYESSKLLKSLSYQYFDDSFSIMKIIQESENEEIDSIYSPEGLLLTVNKFYVLEEEKYLTSEKNIIYDQDNKIIQEESKDYSYSEDYKKQVDCFSKKYKYLHNEDGIPPDFEYFENDVLKMKNKYTSEKGSYSSQVFFSDDISVKSYYKNNFRVQDIYYKNKNVVRVRNYEKDSITKF